MEVIKTIVTLEILFKTMTVLLAGYLVLDLIQMTLQTIQNSLTKNDKPQP